MKRHINKIAAIATVLGLAAYGFAGSDITSVTTKKVGGGLEVAVNGTNLNKPRILRVIGNTSFIVEFDGWLRTSPQHLSYNDFAGVKYVEFGWYSARPPKVRVHLKVDASVEPVVVEEDGTWYIRVNVSEGTEIAAEPNPIKSALNTDKDAMAAAVALLQSGKLPTPVTAQPTQTAEQVAEVQVVETQSTALPLQIAEAQQQIQVASPLANIVASNDPTAPLVSLDFVNTDVIQILKALSMQVGVNIVAAPSVSPEDAPNKLSVTLDAVPLNDALNFITAMAGLRYATVGNTFFVTKSSDFSTTMRNIMDRTGGAYETRVIKLESGAAADIKSATVTAMPPDGRNGFYQIIVPGEPEAFDPSSPAGAMQAMEQMGDMFSQMGQAAQAVNGGAPATPPAAQAAAQPEYNGRSQYLMLIGESRRLDDVHAYVVELDGRIANSISISGATAVSTAVVPILSGETARIRDMLVKVLSNLPGSSNITIEASELTELAEGEASTKILLMVGPQEEIATLESMAMALDEDLCAAVGIHYTSDPAALERYYEVVDLNYIEPVVAEFDLKSRIRGLQVSILPDPVTPGIKGEDEGEKKSDPGSAEAAAEGGQQEVQKDEITRAIGHEPMRLVLRGTKAQIDEAKFYLQAVDIRPAQVALELRVMELTREEALRVGLDWSLLSGGRVQFARSNQGLGSTSDTAGTISAEGNFFGGATDFDVLATLDEIANSSNLIARPNALVTDGRGASWFVGDTIRYIETIQSTQNGVTIQIGEEQVGVTFNVLARVGGDGNIAIDLEQEFSFITGFTPVPGGGSLPQTSNRMASTFVNLQSGETIALGGLIQEKDVERVSGIPILKDLPIIGWLFKRRDDQTIRREIVFFLSARVVDTPEERATAADPRRSEAGDTAVDPPVAGDGG